MNLIIERSNKSESVTMMMIHGDRRLGIERRSFDYSGHYPERRTTKDDRRSGVDRRDLSSGQTNGSDRRCTD